MFRLSRLCCLALFGSASLLLAGCGGAPDDRPELADVTGVVTLDGEPVDGASVAFSPKSGMRGASGQTNAEGEFKLSYASTMGCPLGEHTVEISTRREIQDEYGGVAGMEPETIPPQYRGNSTTLTAEVTADGENHFVFDLTSKK